MPVKERAGQELKGFLGVNLRRERLDLADEELAKAINADLHLQPGSIVLRRGRTKQFAGALSDASIRRLAKINSRRYRIAGHSVYRDATKIVDGTLSANLFTTLLSFRPLNDPTTWAFIADDSAMLKDDGTSVVSWGIAAPTVEPPIQAGSGTLNGDYSCVYTYARKTADGKIAHESNPSPASRQVTLTNGKITVTDLDTLRSSDTQVTHVRFYRTVADGVDYLFELEVAQASIPQTTAPADPVDTTGYEWGYAFPWEIDEIPADDTSRQFTTLQGIYAVCFAWESELVRISSASTPSGATQPASLLVAILEIGDSALGTAVERDNDVPPAASWVAEFQGHAILCRDAANPHYLWFSKRFRPESVPVDNFLEIGNPDDPLQCAVPLAGQIGVFSQQTKYRVLGNATSGFVATEAISRRGTPAGAAAIPTEFALIYLAREGVFSTTLLAADQELSGDIAPIFWGESVNGIGAVTASAIQTASAAYWQGVYYLSLPTGGSSSPNLLACFSRDTKRWYFFDHPARSLFVEEDVDDLTAGFTDGFVYILEDGATDDGASVSLAVETADRSGQADTLRKLFLWLRIDADTQGADLSVDLYVDGVIRRTATISGSRTKSLVPFPEGSLGYAWRAGFRYTGTSRVRVYGCSAIWLPLEIA